MANWPSYLFAPPSPSAGLLGAAAPRGLLETPADYGEPPAAPQGLLGGFSQSPFMGFLRDNRATLIGTGLAMLTAPNAEMGYQGAMQALSSGREVDFARKESRLKREREAAQQAAYNKLAEQLGIPAGLPGDVIAPLAVASMKPKDPVETFRLLSPDEVKTRNLDPNQPWQVSNTSGQIGIAGGRAPQTNVNSYPAPEKGWRNVYDDQGRLTSQEPIPHGPVAQANDVRETQTTNRNLAAVNAIDQALEKIEGPNAPPQWTTTGVIGAGIKNWPIIGQASTDLNNTLNTVKSSVTIETLQAMRQSNPSGGALGQVSDYENQLLGNAKTNIEQSTNGAELAHNLKYLKALITYEVEGVPGISPEQWNAMSGPQKAQAVDVAAKAAADASSGGWQDMGNGTRIRRVR